MKSSQRLSRIPPYPFARWSKRVSALIEMGRDVIRLDIGNPDLPPPGDVIQALCNSVREQDHHGYPGYRGIPEFRNGIANYYQHRFGVTLDPETEIVPLLGSKEGIVNLALAWLDPGDLVLVPDPGYAPYTAGAHLAGAQVYPFPLLPERGFLPDLNAIPKDVAARADMIWLNYPNNPTGATADLEFFKGAVALAQRNGWLLCHDAPYCDVTYDGYQAPSLLQVPGATEVAVEFNSLSKTWNMAGWRVGMAVGNGAALAALAKMKGNMDSGIFRPVQEAATRALALEPQWIVSRNAQYRERISILIDGLKAAGMQVCPPQATLYAWAQLPTSDDAIRPRSSETFAVNLLEKASLAVAPGSFFGPAGEGYIRFSVTAPTERIREATHRLRQFTRRS